MDNAYKYGIVAGALVVAAFIVQGERAIGQLSDRITFMSDDDDSSDKATVKGLARRALDWINTRLDEGYTVYLRNPRHSIKITPKTAKKWADGDRPLFKIRGEDLLIARGKSYDRIISGGQRLMQFEAIRDKK